MTFYVVMKQTDWNCTPVFVTKKQLEAQWYAIIFNDCEMLHTPYFEEPDIRYYVRELHM